jgi:hypothetical protein
VLGGGLDLRDDRSPKTSALFQFGQFGFSSGFLFGRVVENNRAVLRANVGALTIARGRIMVAPKNVEHSPIFAKIELDSKAEDCYAKTNSRVVKQI